MTFLEGGDRNLVRLIVDRLAGITPVAATWGVDPTNLDRCTDGDWGNTTGTGNKNVAAYTLVGTLKFDMGAIYNVYVRGKILMGNDVVGGGSCVLQIGGSEDDATYYNCLADDKTSINYLANTTEVSFVHAFVRGRYILLEWWSDGDAGTYYGAVNELQALDLRI